MTNTEENIYTFEETLTGMLLAFDSQAANNPDELHRHTKILVRKSLSRLFDQCRDDRALAYILVNKELENLFFNESFRGN